MTEYLRGSFDFNSPGLVEVFDELPFWAAPFGIRLLEKVVLRKGMTAVDIGFGAGFPLTELAMRLGATGRVYGIDPWKAATERVKKKIAAFGIGNVQIIEAVAEHIPLETGSVDLIVSNNGLNNVSDLGGVLRECSRILRSGGQLVQTMNLDRTMIEFYEVFGNVLRDMGLTQEILRMKEHIAAKRKPLEEIVRLLADNGFSGNEATYDVFEYNFVDGTAMLNHHFIRMAFLDSWKNLVPADRQETVFREAERRMNDEAAKDGSFQLSVPFAIIDSRKG